DAPQAVRLLLRDAAAFPVGPGAEELAFPLVELGRARALDGDAQAARGDGDGVVLMDAIGAPGTLTVGLPQSTRRASAQVAALGSPSVASPPSQSPCERREQRIALRRASRSPSTPAGAAAVSAYPIARIGDGRPGRSRRCALPTTAFLETPKWHPISTVECPSAQSCRSRVTVASVHSPWLIALLLEFG